MKISSSIGFLNIASSSARPLMNYMYLEMLWDPLMTCMTYFLFCLMWPWVGFAYVLLARIVHACGDTLVMEISEIIGVDRNLTSALKISLSCWTHIWYVGFGEVVVLFFEIATDGVIFWNCDICTWVRTVYKSFRSLNQWVWLEIAVAKRDNWWCRVWWYCR